jgi:hypothetical protein
VGHESYATLESSGYVIHDNDYYGAGVNHSYFMNGIDKSGFTFGVSIHGTNADFDENTGGFLQVGYQF